MPIFGKGEGGVSAMITTDAGLVGRDEELSMLSELVTPPYERNRVLLILGDPGLGKTALLAEAEREARLTGMRVLAAAGRESEQHLAFAGLHQLLRPVLDRVACLPGRQAEALRGAFGLSDDPVPPDALLTGIAVLTLLSGLSDVGPLLVAADDAQWLDRASLDALAFAARRLETERLVLLIGARGSMPPQGFERDFPRLPLAPLSLPDAGRLLDLQPHPPRGQAREQVLDQAAGNPLALIELAKMIAADSDAARRWAAEPLPLTGQLTAAMTARYAGLPAAARAALLLAAVADSPDLTASAAPGLSVDALAPAEVAGLIRLDTPGPQFTHPLIRSAVYHAAPFAERAAAHLQVANALRDLPDRYAWHVAAAALKPDEHVAALLENSAAQAQRRGGTAAAARALERAAELSPAEPDKARRLLAAAGLALPAGQADWVRELAGQVLTLTTDPDLRLAARLKIGWSLLWSNRNAEALEASVARALRDSGLHRGEVFITTKFLPGVKDPLTAAEQSLRRLGTDHVDLYLTHWPQGGPTWAWPGMESAAERGYARSIGISNFGQADLASLTAIADRMPAVDQVNFNPFANRRALLEACERRKVALEAYSPLGTGRHLSDPTVAAIAAEIGRTPAQVLLRWLVQRGIPVVSKSTHRNRIEENLQIFDFALDDQAMSRLDALDKTGGTGNALERKWWS